VGGLVEISGTGARLYMTRQFKPGDVVPLVVHTQKGKALPLPVRVVWVKRDEPGNVEMFEARMRYLQEMIARKVKVKGMPYGLLYGVRFEKGADPEAVKTTQRALDLQREAGREPAVHVHIPDTSAPPMPFRPS